MNDAPRGLRVGADVFPYADVGRGRPILFLHAAPGDHRMWQPHMALLADRWRCLAYTQRWFGTESWRPDGPPFGSATHATDLVNFVTALDIGPVALAAWSYSGHVALAAALARPDLFTSLFVYEPGFATYVTDPELLEPVGNYALGVTWRDRHSSIFAFDALRASCPCPTCTQARKRAESSPQNQE